MKKIILSALLIGCGLCFAEPFKGGKELVETFLQKGQYIKIESNTDVDYVLKSGINRINVDSSEIHYCLVAEPKMVNHEISANRYNFRNDETGNLIAELKK